MGVDQICKIRRLKGYCPWEYVTIGIDYENNVTCEALAIRYYQVPLGAYLINTRKMLEHWNGGASMKEKERGKNETEKKEWKKSSNAGIEPATS